MAIVIKGASRGNAGQMATYILAQGKNELSQVHDVRGTLATDPRGALVEMAAIASGSHCRDFIYHAQINPEKDDHLTPEQWRKAVDALEKNLKLDDHQRVVFEHVKDGRQHYHVVWNRVSIETLKAVNMGNNYLIHEQTGVELEKEFGLEPLERRPNLEGGRQFGPRAGELGVSPGRTPGDRPARHEGRSEGVAGSEPQRHGIRRCACRARLHIGEGRPAGFSDHRQRRRRTQSWPLCRHEGSRAARVHARH
jgi:hypothetical protein